MRWSGLLWWPNGTVRLDVYPDGLHTAVGDDAYLVVTPGEDDNPIEHVWDTADATYLGGGADFVWDTTFTPPESVKQRADGWDHRRTGRGPRGDAHHSARTDRYYIREHPGVIVSPDVPTTSSHWCWAPGDPAGVTSSVERQECEADNDRFLWYLEEVARG